MATAYAGLDPVALGPLRGISGATQVYLGAVPAKRVYVGDTLVWEVTGPSLAYIFFRSDGSLEVSVDSISVFETAGFGGPGTLTSTLVPVFSKAVSLSGPGALSGAIVASFPAAAALASSGSLSMATVQDYSVTPALSGSGALSATITPVAVGAAAPALSGSGALSATAVPFTPTALPGLGLWLDAMQIIGTDGAAVTTWADHSGSGHDVVSADTPPVFRPAGLNDRPAVEFTGSLSTATPMRIPGWGTALTGKTDYTMFMVIARRPVNGSVPVVLTAPYDYGAWKWLVEYGADGGMYWGHVGYRFFDAGIPDDIACLFTFHFPNAPHFYVNSTEITEYIVYAGDFQSTVPDIGADVELGAYVGETYGTDGFISEILWYDHALTDPERIEVEQYLTTKWFGGPKKSPAALTGDGSLSATVSQVYNLTPTLTGAGTFSGTAVAAYQRPVTLTGTGALSATAVADYQRSAALAGAGTLSATATAAPTVPAPVSFWPLTEGAGTTVTDTIGGKTATSPAAFWMSPGTQATFTSTAGVGPAGTLTSWSIAFEITWVATPGGISTCAHDPSGMWCNFNTSAQPGPWSPDQFVTQAMATRKQWLVYVFTPADTRVYIDGVLAPGGVFASVYTTDLSRNWVFEGKVGNYTLGSTRFYNVALTVAQVAALAALGGTYPSTSRYPSATLYPTAT